MGTRWLLRDGAMLCREHLQFEQVLRERWTLVLVMTSSASFEGLNAPSRQSDRLSKAKLSANIRCHFGSRFSSKLSCTSLQGEIPVPSSSPAGFSKYGRGKSGQRRSGPGRGDHLRLLPLPLHGLRYWCTVPRLHGKQRLLVFGMRVLLQVGR